MAGAIEFDNSGTAVIGSVTLVAEADVRLAELPSAPPLRRTGGAL
jgi:hypothetical protein